MMQAILNLLGIGRASLVDDRGEVQTMQVTEGAIGAGMVPRITDRVPRVAEYGLATVPPADSEVLVLRRNGDRGLSIVVGTSHRASRPRGLRAGDVVIHDDRGRRISLTADGIEIDAGGDAVTVTNATRLRCDCVIETTGDVIARVDGKAVSLVKLHDNYQLHVHPPVSAGAQWGSGPPDRQA